MWDVKKSKMGTREEGPKKELDIMNADVMH